MLEKNLQKLERLLTIMDQEGMTKAEFVKAFEQVVNLIMEIKKHNQEEMARMQKMHEKMTEEMKTENMDNMENFAKMKEDAMDYCMAEMKKMYKDHEKMVAAINKKIAEVKDGQDADETKIIQDVLTQIKLPKYKEVVLDNPKQLRDKLETLKGEDRLDKEAIRGLEEEIKGLRAAIAGIPRGGKMGMGRVKVPIMRPVNLTSSVDGSTRSFTLPLDTTQVIGVWGSQFPFTLDRDNDWTLAGNILTLGSQVATPQAGQTLWVLLEVLFYP